jgi:hypothetical protein
VKVSSKTVKMIDGTLSYLLWHDEGCTTLL